MILPNGCRWNCIGVDAYGGMTYDSDCLPGLSNVACTSACGSAGFMSCQSTCGLQTCKGTEVCNNCDDNLNGLVDDADPGVVGQHVYYFDGDADSFGWDAFDFRTCSSSPPYDFTPNPGDCADWDGDVNPAATEVCDGVDNDCDALPDVQDPSVADSYPIYFDQDYDGYGVGAPQQACWRPGNYARRGGDCDDTSSLRYPSAPEYCDGYDNNCDGRIDADDPAAVDAIIAYVDADADGFGATSAVLIACAVPLGTTGQGGDCDDGEASTHPGAIERCDAVDNNCDGAVDENFLPGCPETNVTELVQTNGGGWFTGTGSARGWGRVGAPQPSGVARAAGQQLTGVPLLRLTRPLGIGCAVVGDCYSQYCVDGVCCNGPCDGKCATCAAVGPPGECTARDATTVCRAAIGTCDVPEICDGWSVNCPVDVFAGADVVCNPFDGAKCDAASPACPTTIPIGLQVFTPRGICIGG
ncbi:MAG: MopE-related protein [Myxococcota bacterium]